MKRGPSVFVVLLTVFIDLVGFGMIMPLLPLYSVQYGASGWILGVIGASFSAMQFLFAPIWGRLSDRHGRRPILLISTAAAALSYVMFAFASGLDSHTTAIWMILASRAFAGMCGGNITAAQAYIADVTPPQDRSRRMGLIGMAFGLGFIFGPVISGISLKTLGPTGPGWVAAALCASNFLLAYTILVESRSATSEPVRQRPHLAQWKHTLTQPRAGALIILFFVATFCFSCFELTLPLLIKDHFQLGISPDETRSATTVAWLFVFCALISAFVQGGAIGRMVKLFGEPRLIAISLVLTGVSLALLPFIRGQGELQWSRLLQPEGWPWVKMLAALALLVVGSSLTRPPIFGLLSNITAAHEQGATIGIAQSAGSLARILGPLFAGIAYAYQPPLPYVVCGLICLAAGVIALPSLRGTPAHSTTEPAPVAQ